MTIYLLIKPRGASADQWKIHSRIKKQWRHSKEIAEKLRKELGSAYVVHRQSPYGWPEIRENSLFFPLDFSGNFREIIKERIPRWKNLKTSLE
jgi:hypothetical protein